MALRLKRGTNAQRTGYTPEQGELIYVTDYVTASVSPLWIGDGSTVGGVQVSSAGGGGGLTQVADDTTPELGGNLALAGFEINGIGDIDITGIVTATSFVGDGSSLTGISASGPFVGDLTGSVFADDSTLLVDGINSSINVERYNSATNDYRFGNDIQAVSSRIVVNSVNNFGSLELQRESELDLTGDTAINYGMIRFSRDDSNGPLETGIIVGRENALLFSSSSTGSFVDPTDYFGFKEKKFGIGTITPGATLDVIGDAIITGGLTADLNGSVFADDSTLLVDAVAGTLNLGIHGIGDLGDVSVSSPQTGQVLKWNGSLWTNDSDAFGGGSGGSSSFTNIGIGADDSAVRSILEGESFLILGGTAITTSSDVEGNITIDGIAQDFTWGSITGTPTTLAGYSITDAATTAQGALADTALQPADVGAFTLTGSTMDTSDSSVITITPAVVMSSDLNVENNLVVTGSVTAESFVSSTTGTPEIVAATNLNLTAGNAVVVTSSVLRLASFTTTERNALAGQNGDIIYNTTDNKFQGYENGAWANLI
jgi:hypothetical protein